MKNNKGFTLVELLAVIVVLAIILAIAVPRVISVINGAKADSFKASVDMLASGLKNAVIGGTVTAGGDCKATAIPGVRYTTADFATCTYTIVDAEAMTVSVTATGASGGKFGTQGSYTSTR
jgi:type IV pilus assembly protein PilA